MSLPTVSVIVPCYRYAEILEGCVDSVLSQAGVEVRVLILDDCSPDDTPAVASRLAAQHPRVEYRRNETNRGLIATANAGLEWADGDYVVLLSADDLLVPGSLQRATQVMERNPRVGMVYGRPLYAYAGKPMPVPSGRWAATDIHDGAEWIRLRCRTGHNCISSPEVVVRTSVHRQVGGYDPRCTHTSDLNLWLRIAAVSDIAYVRGIPQAIYRIHPGSMLRNQGGTMVDLSERRAAFDAFFEVAPALPGAAGLRATAGRALARQALWRASRAVDQGRVDGPDPVGELVAFAFDVYPDAARLREWRGLRLRRMIGAGRSGWFPPFLATGAAHRLRLKADRLRWQARGI
ncbi:glycosyltransferase family 2 protein [Candidatus Solirubrobacter pratensis]|uniref:glycosyltransferase family 2 protein n=1 Tax=Candidatus Solirubrobacter pratensis TaxID=1298857 RepID=UPI00040C6321|nr:glycosyltransferase family 2 protein [Candidatus Solirubrobacter pratensis]